MAEIQTVTTLRSKRAEIVRAIALYERQLARARADLASVDATLAIYEASGDPGSLPPYADVRSLFRPGELMTLCKAALRAEPMTTRQIVLYIMRAKEMNAGDGVLAKAISSRLINALGQSRRKGAVVRIEKPRPRKWRLGC
jgi:hypothetical protein